MRRRNETKLTCYVIMMTMPMPVLMIGLQETIAQAYTIDNGQAGHLADDHDDDHDDHDDDHDDHDERDDDWFVGDDSSGFTQWPGRTLSRASG